MTAFLRTAATDFHVQSVSNDHAISGSHSSCIPNSSAICYSLDLCRPGRRFVFGVRTSRIPKCGRQHLTSLQAPIPPLYRVITRAFTFILAKLALCLLGIFWIPVETITKRRT
jgi:hypothetical protein